MSTITEIKQQVTSLNNRYITQELAIEQLKKQNERLILLVQNLVEKPSQPTATPISFTPQRTWDNLTSICTPTRPPRQLFPPSTPTDHTASPLPNLQPARRSQFSSSRMVPSDSLFATLDQTFQHIPAHTAYLHQTLSWSTTLHQDLATTQHIWQRFCTQSCLPQRFYTYNGDSKNNKNPLNPVLLQYLQKYTTHFYPDVKPTQAWKAMMVVEINKALRRPMKQKNNVFELFIDIQCAYNVMFCSIC